MAWSFWSSTRKSLTGNLRLPTRRFQTSKSPVYSLAGSRKQQPGQLPALYIEKPNGTEEIIQEEDLYRYMRHRWLFNEERELSRHYLHFNLSKLLNIAVEIAGNGAHHCVKLLKCPEGIHNKAFILTMDNGAELFAKLPNSNAGPAHYTTASEVSTRHFLREVLNIPVPRILAWSSDAANPVGAEYIIEEKAAGVRLGALWNNWQRGPKLDIIRQIIDIEHQLSTTNFSKYGCIYFKEDLLALTGAAETADVSIKSSSIAPDILNRYSIGPLASPELWRSSRSSMILDRGPWKTPPEYTKALGLNELAWVKTHATPRMNYYRSLSEPELPEDALSLLNRYMEISPYLVPQENSESSAAVLWHPDLHLDNVFVDPETYKITCILDWQSAFVAPIFFQCGIPEMFRHPSPLPDGFTIPERPENFSSLSEDDQKNIEKSMESEIMHKYYEAQTCKRAPHHWAVLQQKSTRILRKPVWIVGGSWENRDLFFLRQSLIAIVKLWDELKLISSTKNIDIPCPISFSEPELELHAKEDENMSGVAQILRLFRDQGILPVDGMIEPQYYEIAKENSRKFKDIFVGMAADEEERKLFSKLWPYQDQDKET